MPAAVAAPAQPETVVARPPASTTTVRPAPAVTPASRGFTTDYGYVIGELRRIFLLTLAIVTLLLVLWLLLG